MIFSANPGPDVLGLTAHLIPQVNLGLSALFNTTSASVYLYFDASLGLQGSVFSGKKSQSCLSGNAGINVEMGSQGSFFDIFGNSTGQSIFEKNFTLFQVSACSSLSTFSFFFECLSFPLHDDSIATTGTPVRLIRVCRIQVFRIQICRIRIRRVPLLSLVYIPTSSCYSDISDICLPATFSRS